MSERILSTWPRIGAVPLPKIQRAVGQLRAAKDQPTAYDHDESATAGLDEAA